MILIITIILGILCLLFKRSKCLFCCVGFWLWIVLAFCDSNSLFDYNNYALSYSRYSLMSIADYNGGEIGYFLLTKIFVMFNFTFDNAYKIYVLFMIFCAMYVIRKNTHHLCLPLFFFFLYPAIMNAYNTRNGIAMGIILIAVQILIEEKKGYLIKYIVLVLMASSIHVASLFYLLFIICKFQNNNSNLNIKLLVIIGIILMLYADQLIVFENLMGENRFDDYLNTYNVSPFIIFIIILWQVSLPFLLFFCRRVNLQLNRNDFFTISDQNYESQTKIKFYDLVEKMSYSLLVLCPLYVYTFTYIRITRNILIFVYIYFCKWADNFLIPKWKKFLFSFWIILTLFGLNFLVQSDFEEVILVFYQNNNFLEMFWNYLPICAFFITLIFFGLAYDLLVMKNKSYRKKT